MIEGKTFLEDFDKLSPRELESIDNYQQYEPPNRKTMDDRKE